MTAGSIADQSVPSRDSDATEFGLLYLLLLAGAAVGVAVRELSAPIATALSAVPGSEIATGTLLWVAGVAGAGLLFARARNVEIPTGFPARESLPAAFLAVVGPLVVLASVAGIGYLLLDATVSEVTQGWYGSEVSLWFLARMTILPAIGLGVGYGLLFNGAIQGAIRERYDPGTAVAVTVVVAGSYRWFDPGSGLRPVAAVHALVLLGLIVLLGYATALLSRLEGASLRETVSASQVMLLVLAGVVVVSLAGEVLVGATALTELLSNLSWVGAFAVAAVCYERTRSVWVPMVSLAVFQLSVGLAQYGEFLLGFSALP